LNRAQLALLRWISADCPDGAHEGYSHRISAAALQSRGLVRISGRGPTWKVELTARGRAVLALPEPMRSVNSTAEKASSKPAKPARPLSKTEQLIADLVAAGGKLRVPYWREQGEPDYRQRALAAQRFGKVPADKRLVLERMRGGELEIRLDDALPAPPPVPVPVRLPRPHPVAKRFRDDSDNHQVSRALLARAVRIVHALAAEAERRGHGVANPKRPAHERSARDSAKESVPHLGITVGNHAYSLNVAEAKVLLRGVWEERKRAHEQHRLQYPFYGGHERMKPYDSEATGELSLSLVGAAQREGRAASWSDRKSWRVEDKLPELLQELELRAVEDDERAAEEKRQAEERQRQWESEMERARERFLEAQRAKVLRAHIAARQEVAVMTAYLAELEAAHGDKPDSAEWLAWVRDYIKRVDPFASPPTMPVVAEISRDDLKPFLPPGVNPYGPEHW
jgi:hypothetical protein